MWVTLFFGFPFHFVVKQLVKHCYTIEVNGDMRKGIEKRKVEQCFTSCFDKCSCIFSAPSFI